MDKPFVYPDKDRQTDGERNIRGYRERNIGGYRERKRERERERECEKEYEVKWREGCSVYRSCAQGSAGLLAPKHCL